MEIIQPLKDAIESALQDCIPASSTRPEKLHSAMRFSLMSGGKRVRALIVLHSAKIFPSEVDPIPAATAIECVHAYSLIHDDLPAMDNSDTRRGRPSCHIQFDEATAILAGDALLTEAFTILSQKYSQNPSIAIQLIEALSIASGSRGMIAGQQEDIDNEGLSVNEETLDFIHTHKTARLIQTAIKLGFICGDQTAIHMETVDQLGYNLGMAFQYQDDLLDFESDEQTLGKPVGLDEERDKLNAIKVYGLHEAKSRLSAYYNAVDELLLKIDGDTKDLAALIHWLRSRKF